MVFFPGIIVSFFCIDQVFAHNEEQRDGDDSCHKGQQRGMLDNNKTGGGKKQDIDDGVGTVGAEHSGKLNADNEVKHLLQQLVVIKIKHLNLCKMLQYDVDEKDKHS